MKQSTHNIPTALTQLREHTVTDVFFDLDHTLWDFEKNSALTFQTIFKKNKLKLDFPVFIKTYKSINDHYWKLYRNEKISKEELRFNRLSDTFQQLNYSATHQTIVQLSEDYILHLPDYNYLFSGTLEVLETLSKRYNLHIITNGFREVQIQKLINSKIANYFATVTTSEEAGVKKPHPKIFEVALQKATAQKQQSMMIGDNLEADILGAQQAGLHTVYYDPEKVNKAYKGTKINSLHQLLEFL